MDFRPLLLFFHVAGVVLWVGGMFFAYVCLRPVALELFDPPQRLRLWRNVLARFFAWVWGAVALILASGLLMLGAIGLGGGPLHLHAMLGTGLAMAAVFIYVATGPYARLDQAVAREDWKAGGAALNRIRQCVGFNLLLGVLTVALATLGRWLA